MTTPQTRSQVLDMASMRVSNTLRMIATSVVALLTFVSVAVASSAGQSAQAESSPLGLSAVTAEFVQAEFATHYTVEAVDLSGTPKYSWSLKLELVDRPGAPDPTNPGSAATVDPGCTNNLYGLSPSDTSHSTEFVWHHPDPQDSVPLGRYHCNHQLEGPSGHQGVVTVTVTQGTWVCTASYDGTNSGKGKAASCHQEVASGPPSSKPTIAPRPSPTPIPLHGSPVDGPIETAKKAAAEDAKDNLDIAKHGGLLAFVPGFKEEKRLTGLAAGTQTAEAVGVAKSLKFVKDVAETVGEATSVVFYVGAYFETMWANDPPDANFKSIVKLKVVAPTKVMPSTRISTTLANALNGLMKNDAMFVANLQAMTISFERAQGAVGAKSARFESIQTRLASGYALQASALLAVQPMLQRKVLVALKGSRLSNSLNIPAKLVAPFAAAEQSQAAPIGFLKLLESYGFSNSQSLSAWKSFAITSSTSPLTLSALFNSPSIAGGDASLAKSLRAVATAFAIISNQTAN